MIRILFSLGFRPFFLLAGVAALVPVLAWALSPAGMPIDGGHYGQRLWHAHEMLFGYAVAVMAGFLLTAIRNWTGQATANGGALAALALLWLAGRIAPFMSPVPWLVAAVDIAFLPALAVAAARPLLATGNHRNLIFPGMLLALATANAVVHAALLEVLPGWLAERALEAAALVAMVMISVMAGRVFPFFTERGLAVPFKATIRPQVERYVVPSMILLALAALLREALPWLLPVAAAAATVLHALRLSGWYTPAIWRVPLVWVLQVGYAWLVFGCALFVAVGLGLLALPFAMHAFTAGALGTITLGMMARVSLGHTGRALLPARPVQLAFVLVTVAALLRVPLAMAWPAQYVLLVQLAAVAWALAFVLFLWVYVPILTRPRADGVPG